MSTQRSSFNTARFMSRRLRFSLRSLLLLFFLISLLGVFTNRAQRQRHAVAKIVKDGGWVKYDFQVANRSTPLGPAWLTNYVGIDYFNRVVEASLSKDFHFVKVLPDLEFVEVVGGRVVDDNLLHINRLKSLRRLHIRGSRITEVGLEHIARNPRIEVLDLGGTKLDGMSLEVLKSLQSLRELGLSFTNVDEAQLRHVASFPQLQKLRLLGCQIGDESRSFVKALNLPELSLDPVRLTQTPVRRAVRKARIEARLAKYSELMNLDDMRRSRGIRPLRPQLEPPGSAIIEVSDLPKVLKQPSRAGRATSR